jgi:serine/threonine-protein kinase
MPTGGNDDNQRPGEAGGDYPPNHFVPGPNVIIRGVIGRGGHGTVYEAELPRIHKIVALKVLHECHKHDPELAERIVEEGVTLAQLEHPNIVQVLNAGFTEDDRNLAWVMLERLRGLNGRELLKRKKRLPTVNALEMMIPLAAALQVAHEHGIIHQDLKPENIFVHTLQDKKTVTKLCDFSIQRKVRPSPNAPAPGEFEVHFEGTLPYAAPEQITGSPISTRTDIYAFGILLFEFLTGVRPFFEAEERDRRDASTLGVGSENFSSLAQRSWVVNAKIADEPAPKLRSRGVFPVRLEDLVAECLSQDPAKRPATMKEVSRRLTSILENLDESFRQDVQQSTEDLFITIVQDAQKAPSEPRPPTPLPSSQLSSPSPPPSPAPAPSPVPVVLSPAPPPPPDLYKGDTMRLDFSQQPLVRPAPPLDSPVGRAPVGSDSPIVASAPSVPSLVVASPPSPISMTSHVATPPPAARPPPTEPGPLGAPVRTTPMAEVTRPREVPERARATSSPSLASLGARQEPVVAARSEVSSVQPQVRPEARPRPLPRLPSAADLDTVMPRTRPASSNERVLPHRADDTFGETRYQSSLRDSVEEARARVAVAPPQPPPPADKPSQTPGTFTSILPQDTATESDAAPRSARRRRNHRTLIVSSIFGGLLPLAGYAGWRAIHGIPLNEPPPPTPIAVAAPLPGAIPGPATRVAPRMALQVDAGTMVSQPVVAASTMNSEDAGPVRPHRHAPVTRPAPSSSTSRGYEADSKSETDGWLDHEPLLNLSPTRK